MKRKVNLAGPTTLTVSLPSKWAKQHNIKKGDEIEVVEKGLSIIISKEGKPSEKQIETRLESESERYIRSYIGRLYRGGFSKIKVHYDKPECFLHIKKAVNNLIGADITETEMNKCTIRIFPVEEIELEFNNEIVKMLMTLKTIFKIVRQDIENDSFGSRDMIDELRHNNWKMKDFILRSAFMQGVDYEEFSNLCHTTFCYEKIGSKVVGFYKRYLMVTKNVIGKKKIYPIFDRIISFIDWLISRTAKNEEISLKDETKFRHDVLEFNISIFTELHSDKNMDHAVLTIIYLTSELLDSTVSYLSAYKMKNSKSN